MGGDWYIHIFTYGILSYTTIVASTIATTTTTSYM